MTLHLGDKIKTLRKQRGVTQEQLAGSLGISFQAVSKWENGIALPDITLAPALASYFGITMDELFEFNLKEIEQNVERICDEAYQYRESDPARSRTILEEGLKAYPDNDLLLNNLLYVLNYSKDPDETIAVASKLIEQTTQSDVKYDALRFLAYAYNAKGDTKSALAAVEQIPEIYFTKLSEMAYLLTGKPKLEAARKQKWVSFESILQMMWKMAECYEAEGHTALAIDETTRALRLIEAMEGEDAIQHFQNYVNFYEKQITRMKQK